MRINFPFKFKRKKRTPSFQKHLISDFQTNSTVLKARLIVEVEARLKKRSNSMIRLTTDNRIFEPYVDVLASFVYGHEHYSFTLQMGSEIEGIIKVYEHDNRILINKSHLYFGLAMNSLYLNDTINGMIYWELCQKEETETLGIGYNSQNVVLDAVKRFKSLIHAIDFTFHSEPLYIYLRDQYTFIEEFEDVILKQQIPELFSHFSCALRYKRINYWLKNHCTDMTKIFAQELINSLCVLCEASLKDHHLVTENMLGRILNHDIPNIDSTLGAELGNNHQTPKTGLHAIYPCTNDSDFNSSLQTIVDKIKNNGLTDSQLKAHLLFLTYILRNNSLHDVKSNLAYYNNPVLFNEVIILLFCSVSMIRNL